MLLCGRFAGVTVAVVLAVLLVATSTVAVPYPPRPVSLPTPPPPAIATCLPACLQWHTLAPVIPVSGLGVEGHASGIIGNRIYVSHGYSGLDNAELRIYDITSDTWTLGPAALVPRSEGGGAAVGNLLISIGGRPGLAAVERYDTTTSTWSPGTAMPTPRSGFGLGIINGLVHVVGGESGAGGGPASGIPVADHEVYDPANDSWSSRAPLPVALGGTSATAVIGDSLYVFGGHDGISVVNTCFRYDDLFNSWTSCASMPTARNSGLGGTLQGHGFAIGGLDPFLFPGLSVVEVYDPVDDTWCIGPSKPTPISEVASASLGDANGIYAVGSGAYGAASQDHQVLRWLAPVAVASADVTVCVGDSVTLDGSASDGTSCPAGLDYQWLDGGVVVGTGTTWSPPTTVAGTTTYTLETTCTGVPGCSTVDDVVVTVVAPPTAVAGADVTVCVGDSVTLDASQSNPSSCPGGVTYQWFDGGTLVATGLTWSPPTALPGSTTYTLVVSCSGLSGCGSTDEVVVAVVAPPTAVAGADVAICPGTPVVLDGTASLDAGCPGGLTYTWRNGPTVVATAPTWSPPTGAVGSTTYTLTVSCAGLPGCSTTDTVTVTVAPRPTAAAGPNATTCRGGTVVLDGTGSVDPGCPGGMTYTWRVGAITVATTPIYAPPTGVGGTTVYVLTVACVDPPSCSSSDSVSVYIDLCLAVTWDHYAARWSSTIPNTVEVSWSTVAEEGTVAFVVERAESDNGTFTAVGPPVTAGGGGTSYVIHDVSASARPWYRIVEYTVNGPGEATPPFRLAATGGRQRHR